MKQNAVGLANICIMSTIVLVLISATASLYIGQENIMNTRFKTEFSATSDETTPENIQAMERIVQEETQSRGLEIIHEQKYRYVPLSAMKYDNQLKFDTDLLHDINQALYYSDEILAMKNGKIIGQGMPKEVLTEELLEEVYGTSKWNRWT